MKHQIKKRWTINEKRSFRQHLYQIPGRYLCSVSENMSLESARLHHCPRSTTANLPLIEHTPNYPTFTFLLSSLLLPDISTYSFFLPLLFPSSLVFFFFF